jgi:hypothetical protein
MSENPKMVRALRNRYVGKVFVGRNTMFALGEDMIMS